MGNEQIMVTRPSLALEDNVSSLRTTLEPPVQVRASMSSLPSITSSSDSNRGGVEGSSPPTPTPQEIAAMQMPDIDMEMISRVSAYPRWRSYGKDDLAPRGHGVPVPPEWLWRALSMRLRECLQLHLFNFDIIVPIHPPEGYRGLLNAPPNSDLVAQDGSKLGLPEKDGSEAGLIQLIDINYFPGIEKLPDYENLMVKFLRNVGEERRTTDGQQ